MPAKESPMDHAVLVQAAEWFSVLGSGAGDAEHARWRDWLAASPEHRRAWERVELLQQRFESLRSEPVHQVITSAGANRRRVLKALAICAVGGPALWAASTRLPHWQADLLTGVGEVRQFSLADGTKVWLNTASAVAVNYGPTHRKLELLAGEVLIHTAPDSRQPARPFLLSTFAGDVRPLGTRFTVKEAKGGVQVGVYSGAVALEPAENRIANSKLSAGTEGRMTQLAVEVTGPLSQKAPSWHRGILKVNGMRMDVFLDELARYRRGYLGYADDVAGLRLVGAFPLDDTDRTLAALETSHPVRVRRITPWFVRVELR